MRIRYSNISQKIKWSWQNKVWSSHILNFYSDLRSNVPIYLFLHRRSCREATLDVLCFVSKSLLFQYQLRSCSRIAGLKDHQVQARRLMKLYWAIWFQIIIRKDHFTNCIIYFDWSANWVVSLNINNSFRRIWKD